MLCAISDNPMKTNFLQSIAHLANAERATKKPNSEQEQERSVATMPNSSTKDH